MAKYYSSNYDHYAKYFQTNLTWLPHKMGLLAPLVWYKPLHAGTLIYSMVQASEVGFAPVGKKSISNLTVNHVAGR